MAEYIERETMIQAIREYKGLFQYSPSTNHMILKMEAEDVARDLEAADVAPVVHGRWILRKEPDGRLCFGCSNCGKSENKHTVIKGKYCWSCGAKMDLED